MIAAPLNVACALFARRDNGDFNYCFGCHDDVTLMDLARAAHALGRADEANSLLARASAAGSLEAAGGAAVQVLLSGLART
jgi:hypothetical protein